MSLSPRTLVGAALPLQLSEPDCYFNSWIGRSGRRCATSSRTRRLSSRSGAVVHCETLILIDQSPGGFPVLIEKSRLIIKRQELDVLQMDLKESLLRRLPVEMGLRLRDRFLCGASPSSSSPNDLHDECNSLGCSYHTTMIRTLRCLSGLRHKLFACMFQDRDS